MKSNEISIASENTKTKFMHEMAVAHSRQVRQSQVWDPEFTHAEGHTQIVFGLAETARTKKT